MDADEQAIRDRLIAEAESAMAQFTEPQTEQQMADNIGGDYVVTTRTVFWLQG